MRALVTGGAGFIGSNLVDALVARRASVLVVDDLSTGREQNLSRALSRGARLAVQDITDTDAMSELAAGFRPSTVFHLAAQIDVRRAMRDPVLDATVNVAGTVSLLEATRAANARFVFASTGGAIYGEGAGRPLPLSEAEECLPDSPYGQSKLAAEGYVAYYRRARRVPAVSLRLGNVYGPRQDPLGEAGVIAIFCGAAERGERPTVFGNGRQTRDYVYVGDVVRAFVLAADRVSSSHPPERGVLNVGTGRETDVLELASRLGRLAGCSNFEPVPAPERPGEVQRIALDSKAAERELGWTAETALDEGLERALAALRQEAVRSA